MLNLTYFQSLFNEDNTEIRCRKVLDEISPVVKPIFQQFVERIGITVGNEYIIRSYDTTLTTTYHDARNPTYAEKKKDSDIGRKHYIKLNRKVDDKEYNFLTLELEGISRMLMIHSELNFIPFWAWVRNDKIHGVLEAIPSDYSIFTGWKEKSVIPKEEFVPFVKSCIKPRKRPNFEIGTSLPLEGNLEEESLIAELVSAWEKLGPFRSFYNEEIDVSTRAYDALMLLAATRNIKETHLLGRPYSVDIGPLEDQKQGKRQPFNIYDGEQMLTKGYMSYLDYSDKDSPFQTIIVQLEGHNHIFTSARAIIGDGTIEWWITKSFAGQNQENAKVMANAMRLLGEHHIQVKGSSYYVGSFNNETQSFVEGAEAVKKTFIDAGLLFAHVKGKLELRSDAPTVGTGEEDDPETEPGLEPNFTFSEIINMISNSQFTFSNDIIRDLHLNLTALDDKHFVLLSGISGTGKTQLCRLYANAVYGLEYESENPYFTIIPVRPDWTDATALFGYYSSFEKRYVKTEFLQVLLHALKERDKPHFILLDEMNLARVEYYLSDYLSAVESRKEIPLHQDDQITDIPKKLVIPPNVYVLGTINVDETTHSISDKVLDRAFVMTLSDVDFDSYWERVDQDLKAALTNEFTILRELHRTLSVYELHFGYRSMGEMLQKLYANHQLPEEYQLDAMEALDRVISEKVLTKVRGDERISDMLANLEEWLTMNISSASISLQHVKRMKEELEYYGATQFWR
ncbi:McrB family protein [Neobacillus rhizophilus]|uniref:AAA family ATPase n=1 Tax=Neobacillus rhizophilus TaxID=2833579 RepID=A0A942UCV9_9BACI|nr:AAA family ATPase [Neobacillus rhizophilus]MBS4214989.1 AAA family ATPase [Neobacillus rhizophilus]